MLVSVCEKACAVNSSQVDITSVHVCVCANLRVHVCVSFMLDCVCGDRDLLPVQHTEKFERWVFTFGHDLILHSTK